MANVYKEVTLDQVVNLPVASIDTASQEVTRSILASFVELFKAKHL